MDRYWIGISGGITPVIYSFTNLWSWTICNPDVGLYFLYRVNALDFGEASLFVWGNYQKNELAVTLHTKYIPYPLGGGWFYFREPFKKATGMVVITYLLQ